MDAQASPVERGYVSLDMAQRKKRQYRKIRELENLESFSEDWVSDRTPRDLEINIVFWPSLWE